MVHRRLFLVSLTGMGTWRVCTGDAADCDDDTDLQLLEMRKLILANEVCSTGRINSARLVE